MRLVFLAILAFCWLAIASEYEEATEIVDDREFDEFELRSVTNKKLCKAEVVLKKLQEAFKSEASNMVDKLRNQIAKLKAKHNSNLDGRITSLMKELKLEGNIAKGPVTAPPAQPLIAKVEDSQEDCKRVLRLKVTRCIIKTDAITRQKNKVCIKKDSPQYSFVRKLPEYAERHKAPVEKKHGIAAPSLDPGVRTYNHFFYLNGGKDVGNTKDTMIVKGLVQVEGARKKGVLLRCLFKIKGKVTAFEGTTDGRGVYSLETPLGVGVCVASMKGYPDARVKVSGSKKGQNIIKNFVLTKKAAGSVAKRQLFTKRQTAPCRSMRTEHWKAKMALEKMNPCPAELRAVTMAKKRIKFARGHVSKQYTQMYKEAREAILRCYQRKLNSSVAAKMKAQKSRIKLLEQQMNKSCGSSFGGSGRPTGGGIMIDIKNQHNQLCGLAQKCKETNERELARATTTRARYIIRRRIAADSRLLRECLEQQRNLLEKKEKKKQRILNKAKAELEKSVIKINKLKISGANKPAAARQLIDALKKEKALAAEVVREEKKLIRQKHVLDKLKMEVDWSIVTERRDLIKTLGPCKQKDMQDKIFRWKIEDVLRPLTQPQLQRTLDQCKKWETVETKRAEICIQKAPVAAFRKCLLKQKVAKAKAVAVCPADVWKTFPDPKYGKDNFSNLIVCRKQNSFLEHSAKQCEEVVGLHQKQLVKCQKIQRDLGTRIKAHCGPEYAKSLNVQKRSAMDKVSRDLKACHTRNTYLISGLKHCVAEKAEKARLLAKHGTDRPKPVGVTLPSGADKSRPRFTVQAQITDGQGSVVTNVIASCYFRVNGKFLKAQAESGNDGMVKVIVNVAPNVACSFKHRGFRSVNVKNINGQSGGVVLKQIKMHHLTHGVTVTTSTNNGDGTSLVMYVRDSKQKPVKATVICLFRNKSGTKTMRTNSDQNGVATFETTPGEAVCGINQAGFQTLKSRFKMSKGKLRKNFVLRRKAATTLAADQIA